MKYYNNMYRIIVYCVHLLFIRQEEEGEAEDEDAVAAEVDTADADADDECQVPASQMRQNSTTSRKSSVTFQSVSFEEPDFVATPRTTARSDLYTSSASISFATYRSASPSLSSSGGQLQQQHCSTAHNWDFSIAPVARRIASAAFCLCASKSDCCPPSPNRFDRDQWHRTRVHRPCCAPPACCTSFASA